MYKRLLLVVLLPLLLLIGAPGNARQPDNDADPAEIIRMHSVNSAKLREIMGNIREWREENPADELKQPGMDQELLDDLVEQVEELLYHAELMSIGMPVTNLTRTEMVVFKALGSELYTGALHLQQLVNNQQVRQLDEAYRQLDRTCQACHEMFRGD
ncbi:MAG: hypothetical protein WD750_08620 [Gammaproteobacteria bacterium]